jgi:transcriptional regulator with XRE-family HTH domain
MYCEVSMDPEVGERITKIRHIRGEVNKKEFADLLGVSSSLISDIENGRKEPSKEFLINISIKYAISLNWLLFGLGEMGLAAASLKKEKHPLVSGMEALIKDNLKEPLEEIASRISALEERLNALAPEAEYPAEKGDKGEG